MIISMPSQVGGNMVKLRIVPFLNCFSSENLEIWQSAMECKYRLLLANRVDKVCKIKFGWNETTDVFLQISIGDQQNCAHVWKICLSSMSEFWRIISK